MTRTRNGLPVPGCTGVVLLLTVLFPIELCTRSVTAIDNVVWLLGGCGGRESWKDSTHIMSLLSFVG
jgi:hypothetical protein